MKQISIIIYEGPEWGVPVCAIPDHEEAEAEAKRMNADPKSKRDMLFPTLSHFVVKRVPLRGVVK